MRILLSCAMLVLATSSHAQIFQCTDSTGRKQFQDQPCAEGERSAVFDPSAGNVTTIDSETSRREVQGALVLREEARESVVEVSTPAQDESRVPRAGPDDETHPYDDGYDGYPVYLLRPDRHRDRDDRRRPRAPDETPITEPPRRAGGNYVPPPPTIRQIAPRPPMSPQRVDRADRGDRRDEAR